jgi:hypothetical protein
LHSGGGGAEGQAAAGKAGLVAISVSSGVCKWIRIRIISCRRHQTNVLPSVYAHLQLVSGQLLHASKFLHWRTPLAHLDHVLPPLQLEDSVSSSNQAAADLAAKLEATQAQLAAAPDAATVEQIKVGTRRLSLPEGA